MVFGAGMLAVLPVLACAGAVAGATTWVVDDDDGSIGVDYMSIQAAVDAAAAGDAIEVRGCKSRLCCDCQLGEHIRV